MDQPTATIDARHLVALLTDKHRWITVIRQGSTREEVMAYTPGWPVFTYSDYGMFLVAVTAGADWLAERLKSGLFYAQLHDTYEAAEADAIDHADLIR